MSDVATKEPTSASLLSEVRAQADALIDGLPSNRVQAKAMIEETLAIKLRAEELQAIAAIGEDTEARDEFRELPRSVFAVRVLAHRKLEDFYSGRTPVQQLPETAQSLAVALDERGRLEDSLREYVLSGCESSKERLQRLGQTCEVLLPARQPLVAALVLIPRLKMLAATAAAGDPHVVAPSLEQSEVELLRQGWMKGQPRQSNCARLCRDAAVLRTIIESDLQLWSRLATEQASDDVLGERREVFKRLSRYRLTHEVLAERLQSGQDDVLKTNDTVADRELRTARGRLFGEYLKIVPILRRGNAAITEPMVDNAAAAETAAMRLAKESEEADKESERLSRSRGTTEEVYLDALRQSKQPQRDVPDRAGAEELQQERRRLGRLKTVAGILLVIAAATQVWYFAGRGRPTTIDVSRGEFASFLPVASVKAIGTMLYTKIDGWEEYSNEERERRAEEFGRTAAARGFSVVYFVDTAGEPIAHWTHDEGLKLNDDPS